jgi:hypothetical protein
MVFVNQPVEEPEKSLRDYASPRCEDIQESDSKLEATKYEIKSKIIEMVATNPFEGMVTENPYRHIRHFTTEVLENIDFEGDDGAGGEDGHGGNQ